MNNIVVFGANGRLGREIVKAFNNADWKVRAVTRKGDFSHVPNIESVAADAMVESEVIKASKGFEFIFNALNPEYTKWETLSMPMLLNVLSAAKIHSSTHLFIGNVYNYGSAMPGVLEVSTPQNADTRKGKIRVKMEEAMKVAAKREGVKSIILRAGDFFGGNGRGSSFDLVLVRELLKGIITYPGPQDCVHSWAYLPDLAKAFVQIAEKSTTFGNYEEFNFEGHAIGGKELIESISLTMGREFKTKRFPWMLIRVIGWVYPMFREVEEMSYLWRVPHRLDGSKTTERVGRFVHTSLDKAISTALQELELLPL